MARYGKTDAVLSKPKWLSAADKAKCFFVSLEEAQLADTRAKGIRGPGWYLINEKVGADGQTRLKVECLVSLSVLNAAQGDGVDDAVVGDAAFKINLHPLAASVTAPAGATFTVGTTDVAATYVWQVKVGSAAYTAIASAGVYSGATTATLVISDATGLTGNIYRCITTNSTANASATSKGAKLTVSPAV